MVRLGVSPSLQYRGGSLCRPAIIELFFRSPNRGLRWSLSILRLEGGRLKQVFESLSDTVSPAFCGPGKTQTPYPRQRLFGFRALGTYRITHAGDLARCEDHLSIGRPRTVLDTRPASRVRRAQWMRYYTSR